MAYSKPLVERAPRPASAVIRVPDADAAETQPTLAAPPLRGTEERKARRRSWHLLGALVRIALLGLAYYGSATLSLRLALVHGQVTPVWPPTGIAVVALLLFGRRLWPAITLAAFLVNLPISPSPLVAMGIAAGNTLAPVLAATLLQRVGFRIDLSRLRDAMALVLVAALASMTISASAGTASLVLSGAVRPSAFWSTWLVWWTGDTMGVLLVAPFLLGLWSTRRGSWRAMRAPGEAVALYAGLALSSYLVFRSTMHIQYLVFPFLGWAAWRFRQPVAASAALVASGVAVWAAVVGWGPFAEATLLQRMVNLQVFNASVAFSSFVLAAVLAERREAIAERDRAQEELAHRAVHDPLTDLSNRIVFMDRLSHALAGLERRSGWVAVLFLDLDLFKMVNDTFGHDVGDQVLGSIADRLRALLRTGDTASRFGGDEFAILCEDVAGDQDALAIAERMVRAVREPIAMHTGEVVVTTSVGIALADGPRCDPEALVRQADAAMYRAKERGRNRYELSHERLRRQPGNL
jgi:diguanylate cyclase (GGDEF)-like protein